MAGASNTVGKRAQRSPRAKGWRAELAQAREAADLSITAAARAAGVSQPFWSDVERGKETPRLETLEAMATAVGARLIVRIERS